MNELKEMEKDLQKVKKEYLDAQQALFETDAELEELLIALEELINDYDSDFKLNHIDLNNYAKGNRGNKIGERSYNFLYSHRKIMWFIRTSLMYCRSAKETCESGMRQGGAIMAEKTVQIELTRAEADNLITFLNLTSVRVLEEIKLWDSLKNNERYAKAESNLKFWESVRDTVNECYRQSL